MPKHVTAADTGIRMTRADIVPGGNNRAALLAAVNAAAANAVKTVWLPPGEITVEAQVTVPAGVTVRGHGEDTVIKQITGAVNRAIFYAGGTDDAKVATTVDHAAGTTTLTVPTAVASTLTAGSLVGIECSTLVYGEASADPAFQSRASEIHKVVAVSGTTVEIDAPLLHNHTVAAGAVAWKMNPVSGVTFRDFVMTSADALNIKARNIMVEKGRNILVENVSFRDSGGGLFLQDTFNATAANVEVDNLPNFSNYLGYGIAVGGRSAHTYIENLRGRQFRHLFTTLADERTGTIQWGGPRHVTVRGGVGEQARVGTNYSIWDTHPYGYDIVFDQCRAFGGSSASSNGFQIRSKFTRLINPVARWSANAGIRLDPISSDTEIIGGDVSFSSAGGIGTAKNTRIRGVHIHDNAGAGIVVSAQASGSTLSDNKIENNLYGIHDQSAGEHSGIVVHGNAIPKGATTQAVSLLSPKGNMVIARNFLTGYGVGADGVGGSPGASIRKIDNTVDV